MKPLILIILFSINCFSQFEKKTWDPNISWDDFKGEVQTSSKFDFEFRYQLTYELKKVSFKDSTIYFFKSIAYMDTYSSWVKTAKRNDLSLKYNQAIFNILEINSRKLQMRLFEVNYSFEAQELLEEQNKWLLKEIKNFQEQSDFGKNEDVVLLKLDRTHERLSQYSVNKEDLSIVPTPPNEDIRINESKNRLIKRNNIPLLNKLDLISPSNFEFGVSILLGTGFYSGKNSEIMDQFFNYAFGFDLSYKEFELMLNGSLTSSDLNSSIIINYQKWKENDRISFAIIDLGLNYPIINNSKNRLAPFVGYGLKEFSNNVFREDENIDGTFTSTGFTFGLIYDYKLFHIIRFPSHGMYYHNNTRSVHNIRFKLMITNLDGPFKGNSIQLSLGYYLNEGFF